MFVIYMFVIYMWFICILNNSQIFIIFASVYWCNLCITWFYLCEVQVFCHFSLSGATLVHSVNHFINVKALRLERFWVLCVFYFFHLRMVCLEARAFQLGSERGSGAYSQYTSSVLCTCIACSSVAHDIFCMLHLGHNRHCSWEWSVNSPAHILIVIWGTCS